MWVGRVLLWVVVVVGGIEKGVLRGEVVVLVVVVLWLLEEGV